MLPSTRRWSAMRLLGILCLASLVGPLLLLPSVMMSWEQSPDVAPSLTIERGTGPGGSAAAQAPDGLHAAPLDAPDEQAPTAPADGVRLSTSTAFYAVEGDSLGALLQSLRQRGPHDDGGTWAASTAWVFRWSYQSVTDPACRVASAHVDLDLTYTFPRWSMPADAAPTVLTAWQAYLAHVELHEHGHREIAETAAADLVQALEALPAQESCEAIATSAQDTAAQILARHASAQTAYDVETSHGAAQGAVLTASTQ